MLYKGYIFRLALFCFSLAHSFIDGKHTAVNDVCLFDEYRCGSGECILKLKACDDNPDCRDHSDERKSCRPLQYHEICPSGWVKCHFEEECIPKNWLCDDNNDCADHTDEINCNKPELDNCLFDEYRCGSGECIQKSKACDDNPDCRDHSDERQSCRPLQYHEICPSGWVKCHYEKECVSKDWICDGNNDCPDHSDEINCQETLPDYTWSDVNLVDEPRLQLTKINTTFHDFGKHVAKKLETVGVVRALLIERLINELLFLGQLGLVDEETMVCNSNGKKLF